MPVDRLDPHARHHGSSIVPMKVVMWGTYDTGKPRIRILRDGLRAQGVDITEIHRDIWSDIGDKSSLHGAGKWLKRGLRLLAAYPALAWQYLRAPAHDVVLVSYPGQMDVFIARLLTWLRRKPLVFDWFISAYDTVVVDRRLLSPRNPLAWALWSSEWLAGRIADLAFMDTAAHARRMERLFRLTPGILGHVWVGAEAVFFENKPVPGTESNHERHLQVLFYGQFIPLHGIATIVEAARLVREAPIHWTLIGRGQEAARIRMMLEVDPLSNMTWFDWVTYESLPAQLAETDVCLGIFGTSEKAASVIPNKVFQIIAAGRPLVTRDSPAVRELLDDQPPCTRLVNAGDAKALADAILEHLGCLRTRKAQHCHDDLRARIDPAAIGRQFLAVIARHIPDMDARHDH